MIFETKQKILFVTIMLALVGYFIGAMYLFAQIPPAVHAYVKAFVR